MFNDVRWAVNSSPLLLSSHYAITVFFILYPCLPTPCIVGFGLFHPCIFPILYSGPAHVSTSMVPLLLGTTIYCKVLCVHMSLLTKLRGDRFSRFCTAGQCAQHTDTHITLRATCVWKGCQAQDVENFATVSRSCCQRNSSTVELLTTLSTVDASWLEAHSLLLVRRS